jgi:hypothetical protein
MCSRQYVAQSVTGCSAKGKTIARSLGGGLFFTQFLTVCHPGEAKDLLWLKLTAARE